MKSEDIFIGTIKKCKNLYCYEKYGEKHYQGDFKIGSIEFGSTQKYVDIIYENAILIKVNESRYIWVDLLTNKMEEFLVNMGININTLKTKPYYEGDLFVDEIRPAFKEKKSNLSVKKIRTLVLKK